MKKVYDRIDSLSEKFAAQPLFAYVRDRDIEAERRLDFIPFMAHFVMTFADLYNIVLPQNPPTDRFQELVNAHLGEDAEHWKWFLVDLVNSNLDPTLRYTDALRFIWGADTVATRTLSYRLCQMSGGFESSVEKLVMVKCIEATGKVALEALAVAGTDLELRLGRKLVYFGGHHAETESHHTLEEAGVRESIEEIALGDEQRRASCALVDDIFVLFENSVAEMYRVAKRGHGFDEMLAGRDRSGSERSRRERA